MKNKFFFSIIIPLLIAATGSSTASPDVAVTLLHLRYEKNFVSMPVVPGDRSIESLFSDVLDQVKSIQYYDSVSKKWLYYDPTIPEGNTLKEIPVGAGFFISVLKDLNIPIYGIRVLNLNFPKNSGWNAIGVSGTTSVMNIANQNRLDTVKDVFYSSDLDGYYVALARDDLLFPFGGYWLDLSEATAARFSKKNSRIESSFS